MTIRARVRGFLTERHFAEGAMVKKGQLLLVIDEEPYQVALQSAKARQAEADATLRKAEESKGREVSAAQLELDRAQLLLAQIQERRNRTLVSRNAGSAEDLDKTEADRRRWESQVEADRANLAQAKADYDVGIAVGPGPGLGRQGRRPRRRAEPGLLPDVRPARRPDRRGPGQGRQPRRARFGRRRVHSPSWPRSSSSTRWASTSGSAPGTSTGSPP